MELDEVNRKLQQTQQSVAQRAKNKTVQEYRKEARHEGRTISSTQARHEIKLREIRQNELNKAVNEALQNAAPKAANDPNGFLGRPQEVKELSPEKIPYIVLPEKPKDNTGSPYPNTVTHNLGDDDVEEGETKASILKEGQLVNARRLRAKPDSGLTVALDEEDDSYVNVSLSSVDPEAPYVLGPITLDADDVDEDPNLWERSQEDDDGLRFQCQTRTAFDPATFKLWTYYRTLLYDKQGRIVSISGETGIPVVLIPGGTSP